MCDVVLFLFYESFRRPTTNTSTSSFSISRSFTSWFLRRYNRPLVHRSSVVSVCSIFCTRVHPFWFLHHFPFLPFLFLPTLHYRASYLPRHLRSIFLRRVAFSSQRSIMCVLRFSILRHYCSLIEPTLLPGVYLLTLEFPSYYYLGYI